MAEHRLSACILTASCFILVLLAALWGCDSTVSPTAHHQVSGRVQLIGQERDVECGETRIRVVDPTGTPVYLYAGRACVDSTESISGQYFFDDVPAGTYLVYAEVIPAIFDTTAHFVVNGAGVIVADTLSLAASGVCLTTYPNPFHNAAGVRFSVDTAGAVLLEVVDVSLVHVRDLVDAVLPAGPQETMWDRTDTSGVVVPAGSYWLILWLPEGEYVDLAFVSD